MIQVHRLEGFYRVASAHGYVRAARECPYPITAPALHQQVRKLEGDLGVRLFERVAKDVVIPTSEGRALYDFIAPFFGELPALARALREGRHGGLLRVEAATMELQRVLPKWVARLRAARPELRVQLNEVVVGDPMRLLRGDVDLVVDHLPELPPGVKGRVVATYYAFLVVPNRALGGRRLRPSALPELVERLPFVAFSEGLPQHALQVAGLSMLELDPVMDLSASSTEAILALVSEGLGFSLLPWHDRVGPQRAGVSACRVGGAAGRFDVVAAYRESAADDPRLQAALAAVPKRR